MFSIRDDTGREVQRYLNRSEIRAILKISEATLKRYITLLASECPEFEYHPYSSEFTTYQFNAIKTVRRWYRARLVTEQIIERLRKEGLPGANN